MKTRIVIALAVLGLASPAMAGPVVSGRIYSQWYEQYAQNLDKQTERAATGYSGGQLYVQRLMTIAGGRLDFYTSARGVRLMNQGGPDRSDLALYQAYAKYRTRRLDLRAGRQFLRGGNGARTGDGVRLAVNLDRHLQFVGFGSASVDWRDPQGHREFPDFLWAGARLQVRAGEFRFVPAVLWDKRYGSWRRQNAGFDLNYRGVRHEAGWRLYYDFRKSLLDEMRVDYTWRINSAWRLPVRYSLRTPQVADRDYALEPQAEYDLSSQRLSTISVDPVVSLGSQTAVSAEFSTVLSGDLRRYRQRYSLIIQSLTLRYLRQSGHGPVEDRVVVSGYRSAGRHLRVNGSVMLSQFRTDRNDPSTDRRVSSGVLGATWTPSRYWVVRAEGQLLDTDRIDYELRGFGRVEFRFGGGR